eukprot:jgi/Psemu1/57063/gm1.57063_g
MHVILIVTDLCRAAGQCGQSLGSFPLCLAPCLARVCLGILVDVWAAAGQRLCIVPTYLQDHCIHTLLVACVSVRMAGRTANACRLGERTSHASCFGLSYALPNSFFRLIHLVVSKKTAAATTTPPRGGKTPPTSATTTHIVGAVARDASLPPCKLTNDATVILNHLRTGTITTATVMFIIFLPKWAAELTQSEGKEEQQELFCWGTAGATTADIRDLIQALKQLTPYRGVRDDSSCSAWSWWIFLACEYSNNVTSEDTIHPATLLDASKALFQDKHAFRQTAVFNNEINHISEQCRSNNKLPFVNITRGQFDRAFLCVIAHFVVMCTPLANLTFPTLLQLVEQAAYGNHLNPFTPTLNSFLWRPRYRTALLKAASCQKALTTQSNEGHSKRQHRNQQAPANALETPTPTPPTRPLCPQRQRQTPSPQQPLGPNKARMCLNHCFIGSFCLHSDVQCKFFHATTWDHLYVANKKLVTAYLDATRLLISPPPAVPAPCKNSSTCCLSTAPLPLEALAPQPPCATCCHLPKAATASPLLHCISPPAPSGDPPVKPANRLTPKHVPVNPASIPYTSTLIDLTPTEPVTLPQRNICCCCEIRLQHVVPFLHATPFLYVTDTVAWLHAYQPTCLYAAVHAKYHHLDSNPSRDVMSYCSFQTETVLNMHRICCSSAALLHCQMNVTRLVWYLGNPHLAVHRNIPEFTQSLQLGCDMSTVNKVCRKFTTGPPKVCKGFLSDANFWRYYHYGNHTSPPGNTILVDRRLYLFIPNLHFTPLGIADKASPWKKSHQIFNAPFVITHDSSCINDGTNKKANEPPNTFPGSFLCFLAHVWNLHISFPHNAILIMDNDACGYLSFATGQSFGGCFCPANWDPVAQACIQMAGYQWHHDPANTLRTLSLYIDAIRLSPKIPPSAYHTITQGHLDSINWYRVFKDGKTITPGSPCIRTPLAMPMQVGNLFPAGVIVTIQLTSAASIMSCQDVSCRTTPARNGSSPRTNSTWGTPKNGSWLGLLSTPGP